MAGSDSCLVANIAYYLDLEARHKALLERLEEREESYEAREKVYTGGERVERLFVVKQGWFFGYTNLPNGGRHIVNIYNAGDVIGFSSLTLKSYSTNLQAATAGRLCPFEKQDLDRIFDESPRLAALLFALSSREQVVLIDTLRVSSRMAPRARLAFLFLKLIGRLRVTNPDITNRINMPLTQTDMGDAIGVTNVTVSRTIKGMEQDGLLERAGKELILHDEAELQNICDYDVRHLEIDTSWFPER